MSDEDPYRNDEFRGGLSMSISIDVEDLLLVQKINQSLPQIGWDHYRELIKKRQSGTLTQQEHLELIAISDQLEEANVNRIGYLAELAKVRQTTIPALIKEIGLKPIGLHPIS